MIMLSICLRVAASLFVLLLLVLTSSSSAEQLFGNSHVGLTTNFSHQHEGSHVQSETLDWASTMHIERQLKAYQEQNQHRHLQSNEDITVNVYIHLIRDSSGNGAQESEVSGQIEILNDQFRASTPPGFPKFVFNLRHVTVSVNDAWFSADIGTKEDSLMRQALHVGGSTDMNVYLRGGPTGGHATLPMFFSFPTDRPSPPRFFDGVVLNYEKLPGRISDGQVSQGKILVHEVGHFLGLLEVFHDWGRGTEEGCDPENDFVGDTPATKVVELASAVCPVDEVDSCPTLEGYDPLNNHMHYTADECRTEFTLGQFRRMLDIWDLHRVQFAHECNVDAQPCIQDQQCCGNVCVDCAPSASPSVLPTVAASNMPSTVPSVLPTEEPIMCVDCFHGTFGPCRQANGVCWNMVQGSCPTGSTACTENQEEEEEPVMMCRDCFPGTFGSCRQSNSVCWDMVRGSCPTGTTACKGDEFGDKDTVDAAPIRMCSGCWPGTMGECKQSNTVCHRRIMSGNCPPGTVACV